MRYPCKAGCGRFRSSKHFEYCCGGCQHRALGRPGNWEYADPRSAGGHTKTCEGQNRWPDLPTPTETPDVPVRFKEWALEYIDGFRYGLKADGCWCDIFDKDAVRMSLRRKAWKAGQLSGTTVRKTRQHAV